MIRFSVGYGAHDGFEDLIARYADRVDEVYCAPPFAATSAGVRHVAYEQPYALKLHRFLGYAEDHSIRINLLLDQLCLGADYASEARSEEVLSLLRTMRQQYSIAAVTISSAGDGEMIKRALPDVAVHVSESMFIRHPDQARRAAAFADRITLDRDLNRDVEAIRQVKEACGRPIQLVANAGCVFRCVLKIHVLNAISHFEDWVERGGGACLKRFERDPALILKSTLIRPGDINRYDGLVDSMKLDSLFWDTERLGTLLAAYMGGEYDGNLWEIAGGGAGSFFTDALQRGRQPVLADTALPGDFFDRTGRCSRLCRECGYCDGLAPDTDEEDAVERAVRMALQ